MITEYTADLDRVELNGISARDLSLALNPAVSSITPVEAVSFQADVSVEQVSLETGFRFHFARLRDELGPLHDQAAQAR